MRLAGLFPAEHAEVKGDRLHVKGGAWDGLRTSRWPAVHELSIVALLRPDPDDVGVKYHLDFNVTAPGGQTAGYNHYDVVVQVLRPQVPIAVSLKATMPEPGRYTLSFSSRFDSDEVTFDVVGPDVDPVSIAVEGHALGLDVPR